MGEDDLKEIVIEATKKVSEQLNKWTKSDVEVVSGKGEEVFSKDIDKIILSYIKPILIYSSLEGEGIKGLSLTILERKEAIVLAKILTNQPNLKVLDEKSHSALRETSNVVSGTYSNIVARKIGNTINSDAPLILNKDDLDDLKKDLEKVGNTLFLFRTKFNIRKQNINIGLFLFFNGSIEIKRG